MLVQGCAKILQGLANLPGFPEGMLLFGQLHFDIREFRQFLTEFFRPCTKAVGLLLLFLLGFLSVLPYEVAVFGLFDLPEQVIRPSKTLFNEPLLRTGCDQLFSDLAEGLQFCFLPGESAFKALFC